MSYLSDECTFRMFTPSFVADGVKFICGDSDLDEFFIGKIMGPVFFGLSFAS